MFRKLLLALSAVCLMASSSLAEKTYVVLGNCDWPPLEFIDTTTKQPAGYEVEYIKAVADAVGMKIEYRNTAWDGIFAALANGQGDIIASGVTVTEERKKSMAFATPFLIARQSVVVPISNTTVNELKDLDNLKVGGQIGTTGLIQTMKKAKQTVAKKVQIKSYDEVGLAFADLAKGNIDAVICDSPVAALYAKNKPEYAKMMRVAFNTDDMPEEIAFCVMKKNSDIIEKLNRGIQIIKENGTAKQLADKWGFTD